MGAVELVSITPNAMELFKREAGVCYQKEATEAVIEKIRDMGHWSVFEHCRQLSGWKSPWPACYKLLGIVI